MKTGVSPRIYDRADWTSAFLPKDESPMLGDVNFVRETRPVGGRLEIRTRRPAPRPESPLADTGPDVEPDPAAPRRSSGL